MPTGGELNTRGYNKQTSLPVNAKEKFLERKCKINEFKRDLNETHIS
jgi:hypothetical protein